MVRFFNNVCGLPVIYKAHAMCIFFVDRDAKMRMISVPFGSAKITVVLTIFNLFIDKQIMLNL